MINFCNSVEMQSIKNMSMWQVSSEHPCFPLPSLAATCHYRGWQNWLCLIFLRCSFLQLLWNSLSYTQPVITLADTVQLFGRFHGLLHMEVFHQRLENEHGASVITTPPTVPYRIEVCESTLTSGFWVSGFDLGFNVHV